jgi:hypothetical protein
LADDWGRGKGGCSILILSREFNSIPHALLEWKSEGPAWMMGDTDHNRKNPPPSSCRPASRIFQAGIRRFLSMALLTVYNIEFTAFLTVYMN